ncbi:probable SprT-like domain-containing protein Spartan at N-terminal half [Coccomyxa sp. Obi]|nr:probable SprT-like domain-containing protein Spartan at N-terminal half [Coccomyxa sp. Obi]
MAETEFDILEPHPDIHALFMHFNELYFERTLVAASVEWSSKRMTSCAGTCSYTKDGGCVIKLSEPILKYRPTKDLKEVLLHEMIHAYLFLNKIRDSDHGPRFCKRMHEINTATFPDHQRPPGGYNITTHHSMIAEVRNYQTHHWQCEKCGNMVKRAMNRCPQEADCRGRMGRGSACTDPKCAFHMHIRYCGGAYIKVAEPEGYMDKRKRKGKGEAPKFATAASQALPVKRPRSIPSQGSVQITDFFERIVQPSVDGTGKGVEQQQQQQQQQSQQSKLGSGLGKKPAQGQGETAEQRRRLLAEAALRRQQASSNAAAGAHVDAPIPSSSAGGPSGVEMAPVLLNGIGSATGRSPTSSSSNAEMMSSQRNEVHGKGAEVDLVEPECDVIVVDEDEDDDMPRKLPNRDAAGIAGSTPSTSDWVDLAAEEDVAERSKREAAGHISSRLSGAPVVLCSEAVGPSKEQN